MAGRMASPARRSSVARRRRSLFLAREVGGDTLMALTVQARLADAATALEGARLLVEYEHSWPALSYVAAAAVDITGACHQLTGALGYTLDYPLQRRSRRVRAMRSWADWAADAATRDTIEKEVRSR